MHARTPLTRPFAAFAALLLLGGIALAACGDDDDNAATGGNTTTTASEHEEEVTVTAKDFSLTDATVAPGEDVYFANKGAVTHTMTSDDGTSFDTGNVAAGETKEFKAPTQPGTYEFHCTIHPQQMKATLTVQG